MKYIKALLAVLTICLLGSFLIPSPSLYVPPEGYTLLPNQITQNHFKLRAEFNPWGAMTQVVFEYGFTPEEVENNPKIALASEESTSIGRFLFESDVLVSTPPFTLYYFRARATNFVGECVGDIIPFRTGPSQHTTAIPKVRTGVKAQTTATTASLSGNITANGFSTSYLFKVWKIGGEPFYVGGGIYDYYLGGVPNVTAITGLATGLEPNSNYAYTMMIISAGTAIIIEGFDTAFTTGNFSLPESTTPTISQITQTTARASCIITSPEFLPEPDPPSGDVYVWFGVGVVPSPEGNYPLHSPVINLGPDPGLTSYSFTLGGPGMNPLPFPGTNYYVRCFTENLGGISMSEEVEFTTLP